LELPTPFLCAMECYDLSEGLDLDLG
jgi:hypothetical protein